MSKVRVYELARDMKIESKILMNTLKSIGITLPSHQSVLTDDQLAQLKRALAGEKEPAKTAVRAAETSSVRVIRRRRGHEGQEEANHPEETPTLEIESSAPATTAQVEAAPVQQVVEPVVSESPIEVTKEVSPVKPETAPPVSVTSAPAQAPTSRPVNPPISRPGGPSSASVVARPGIPPRPSYPRPNEPYIPRRNEGPRRPPAGGATIVRKATPEEIKAREQQQQNYSSGGGYQRPYQSNRPTARREDSRGTKYTGFGGAPVLDTLTTLDQDEGRAARRTKEKKKETVTKEEDESSALAKKPTAKSGRKSGYNMRQLLSEIEDSEESVEVAEVEEAEAVEAANQRKTVYTPHSGQKKRDLKRRKDLKKTEVTVSRQAYRTVHMGQEITVGELAHQLKVKATDLIKKLMEQGVMVTINQGVDMDTATLLASDFGFEVKSNLKSMDDVLGREAKVEEQIKGEEVRPPIVTVMGHVDHGKTSILDAIRKTSVASGEAGGITQHIGAYSVQHNGKKIAFLDTPGHEAFSSMRARGANVTDIVVLVVAADDGVMPQTVEAISHAKDAKVPIIVAVNKIDKEQANIDRIYRELSEKEIIAEEWGGEIQFVKCSALTKQGIDELLEAVLLQAEVLELRTSSTIPAEGVVIEAHLDSGRGPIATVMIKHGSLRTGDYVVAGKEFGRVRAMMDHLGKRVDVAGPATPVQVLGLSGVPTGGDRAAAVKDEKTAREAVEWVAENLKKTQVKSSAQSLQDLLGKMQTGDIPELPVIVRADTQGSLEAIIEAMAKLNSDRVKNRIVHRAVGGITESDVSLAETSGAVVIGFNIRAARGLDESAEKRGVVIRYFSIIYDLVDSVKALMAGKLPSILEEVVIGRAEVRQSISVPKFGTIAGSAVIDGRITRSSSLRLIRENVVVYAGKISSLRRFKDDVKEVKLGYECGIGIENYNDIKIGDVIEAYEIKETRPTL